MGRIVNKYTVPDGTAQPNRQGAIKRIQEVFEANKEAITASVYEVVSATHAELDDSVYDVFERSVLDNLSEDYGGNDARKKVKNRYGTYVKNDVNIEQAIDKTLLNQHFTPLAERYKRNFLTSIRNANQRMYNYIKSQMGARNREHGYYDGIPLGDITYDEFAEHTTYLIRTADGKFLKAVFEAVDGENSPTWHLYDVAEKKEIIF